MLSTDQTEVNQGLKFISNWSSKKTYENVKSQIIMRYGEAEAEVYNPKTNCLTFNAWVSQGYCVKKGEKAFRSIIVKPEIDLEGKTIHRKSFFINLFYYLQVVKI
jgi:hypothetical protein